MLTIHGRLACPCWLLAGGLGSTRVPIQVFARWSGSQALCTQASGCGRCTQSAVPWSWYPVSLDTHGSLEYPCWLLDGDLGSTRVANSSGDSQEPGVPMLTSRRWSWQYTPCKFMSQFGWLVVLGHLRTGLLDVVDAYILADSGSGTQELARFCRPLAGGFGSTCRSNSSSSSSPLASRSQPISQACPCRLLAGGLGSTRLANTSSSPLGLWPQPTSSHYQGFRQYHGFDHVSTH